MGICTCAVHQRQELESHRVCRAGLHAVAFLECVVDNISGFIARQEHDGNSVARTVELSMFVVRNTRDHIAPVLSFETTPPTRAVTSATRFQ
eukprot:3791677-Amphidinium_carterae.3